MRLKEKAVIVTGGTSGIGRAIAERVVKEGGRVLVHGIDRAGGEAVVAKLGKSAALHLDDLVDAGAPKRIVAAALQAFGRIDAIVNNAALVARSTLQTTSVEFFERMMAINVRAPLMLIQAAYPALKQAGGAVLNIGSINAYSGEATLLDYSISKGALMVMTRNLANANAHEGVRINQFNVGWVLTEREHQFQLSQGLPEDWHRRQPLGLAPTGRLLMPEEIAEASVYWLGDESRPINGQVFEVEQFSIHGRNPVKA